MKSLKIKQNLNIISNQLRLKIFKKHIYLFDFFKQSSNISVKLLKQKSFNDDAILETLLLLDFLSYNKSYINHYQRKYQQVNIQLSVSLRKYNLYFFLFLLQYFYFPLFIRRNLIIDKSFDTSFNIMFNLSEINIIPFISDIYFKWNTPLTCVIYFNNLKILNSKGDFQNLVLSYFNFPSALIKNKNLL